MEEGEGVGEEEALSLSSVHVQESVMEQRIGRKYGRWRKRRERRQNPCTRGRIGEARGNMRRKEKNDKEKKEVSILLLLLPLRPAHEKVGRKSRRKHGREREGRMRNSCTCMSEREKRKT